MAIKPKVVTIGRDKSLTLRLLKSDGDVQGLTGWTYIKARLQGADNTALEKLAPLDVGLDEIQSLTFSATPTSGTYTLTSGQYTTGLLNWDDDAATIQAALQALPHLSDVVVAGSVGGPFTVTYSGNDGKRAQDLLELTNNNLLAGTASVTATIVSVVGGQGESGIEILSLAGGQLKLKLNESDTAELKKGLMPLELIVRIGQEDLNIPALEKILDVRESPIKY